ncbi:Elongator complex protein 2 [Apostasia shenzhenica]|uniref:Elongator complex protein 2 n=1 Tax=Apostasia shenzhenica TaxID=1088818 RepID=A0A2H9ZV73_9ASPA|nr:Elongator complex protein 2 [Apostasia shenzhenica]
MLWEFHTKARKWRRVLEVPQMHKKGVTCLASMMFSENIGIFASTSSDNTIVVWETILSSGSIGDCEISSVDSFSVGSKPMVALSLAELPDSKGSLVLATGGLDNKIHLYCGARTGKFVHACELKAHTDWIRSLDFSLPISFDGGNKYMFLVSSSQDKCIRIWKITFHGSAKSGLPYKKEDIGLTSFIEGPLFISGDMSYQVSLESLLVGHEDWVYSVKWQPPLFIFPHGEEFYQPMSILSASMDKTMMIWKPEKNTGIWVNMVTVGELSHSALGFFGGHWAPDGASILAHGYGGAFHLWQNIGVDLENWKPQKVPSGHFASVSDIVWAKSGEYLLSVSHDQTTRIFSPWNNDACEGLSVFWHEIARPQVHGHDINCVAIIQGSGNHRFVSGAEEKVVRVFEAPLSFLKTLRHAALQQPGFEDLEAVQVLGANMSALGLSQRPIYLNAANGASSTVKDEFLDPLETIPDAVPIVLTQPPIEEQLAWHTLWPESHKLYGHGNELFSLCCDHEGVLVASSCKAQSVTVAEIWLWEVGSWKAVGRLQSHSLTVTQIEFSHDDAFLLSVSRDRQFSVFAVKKSGGEVRHQLITKHEAHKRIIWACTWNPFCHQFATGSRDKTVKIWAVEASKSVKQIKILPAFQESVTALSWLGCDRSCNTGLLAVGMENGLIELWHLSGGRDASQQFNADAVVRFDPYLSHVSTVHRLAWRPVTDESDLKTMQLASCGADNCVRLFQVQVK